MSTSSATATRPLLERMASFCFNHRRIVLLVWILALPASFGVSGALGGKFNDAQSGGGGTESAKAIHVEGTPEPVIALGRLAP